MFFIPVDAGETAETSTVPEIPMFSEKPQLRHTNFCTSVKFVLNYTFSATCLYKHTPATESFPLRVSKAQNITIYDVRDAILQ